MYHFREDTEPTKSFDTIVAETPDPSEVFYMELGGHRWRQRAKRGRQVKKQATHLVNVRTIDDNGRYETLATMELPTPNTTQIEKIQAHYTAENIAAEVPYNG